MRTSNSTAALKDGHGTCRHMSYSTELLCFPEAAKLAYLQDGPSTAGMLNEIHTEEEVRRQRGVHVANIMIEYVMLTDRNPLHRG